MSNKERFKLVERLTVIILKEQKKLMALNTEYYNCEDLKRSLEIRNTTREILKNVSRLQKIKSVLAA